MKALMYSTRHFDEVSFNLANQGLSHEFRFSAEPLNADTASHASDCAAVIVTASDHLDDETLSILAKGQTKLIALRCKGYNNVDLEAASRLGLHVVRVPSYSPYSVAEHVFALLLALIRHIPQSQSRAKEENFTIEGLIGSELHGKTFGIIGAGQIGLAVAQIAHGFGCHVIAYDLKPDAPHDTDVPITFLPLEQVIAQADILSLHVPLMTSTRHLIDAPCIATMKRKVILINTARGAIVDTLAVIAALKSGQIGAFGLDVYELEDSVFNHDLSGLILADDVFARLLTFNNVLITSHMGFLTHEALKDIAATSLASLTAFERNEVLTNEIRPEQ